MGLFINTCSRRLIPPRNFGFICGWFGGSVSERENYAVEGEYNPNNFLRSACPTHCLSIKVCDMKNHICAPPVVLHDVGYIMCRITWCPGEVIVPHISTTLTPYLKLYQESHLLLNASSAPLWSTQWSTQMYITSCIYRVPTEYRESES